MATRGSLQHPARDLLGQLVVLGVRAPHVQAGDQDREDMALDPRLKVIAPWREWNIKSREDALAYCASHNVPVSASLKSIYSRDRNLWHISHEGGILEDPWFDPTTRAMRPCCASVTTQRATLARVSLGRGKFVAAVAQRISRLELVRRSRAANFCSILHACGRILI